MQITIIGSTKGHGFNQTAEKFSQEIGQEIAKRGYTLLYGPEPEVASLPYMTAKACKIAGGTTIAIAIPRSKGEFYDKTAATHIIYTDGGAGASREVVLVNSADAIISIGGGSGTLTEISIGYMNAIPTICMKGSGGWSDKLIGTYLDDRKKFIFPGATTAKEALDLVEKMAEQMSEVDPSKYV